MDERPENPIVDILTAPPGEPNWLIPDLLLQGALIVLAGEPGTGKSYVSYTLGLAVASGCKALSGLVPEGEPRRVLYFDEENSEQDRNKYLQRAWKGLEAANGVEPDLGLLLDNFWPVHMHLGVDDWEDRAREWIQFVQPHFIIIDTATPAFNLSDENDNSEATQAGKALRRLMRDVTPMATILVLKHANTLVDKGKRTIRGAKAWKSFADGLLFQVKANGRPRKSGLSLTRLEPDKIRAYGLPKTIYITPSWTDEDRNGLQLEGSYAADREHRIAEESEEV